MRFGRDSARTAWPFQVICERPQRAGPLPQGTRKHGLAERPVPVKAPE
jgi:hypothetical protein